MVLYVSSVLCAVRPSCCISAPSVCCSGPPPAALPLFPHAQGTTIKPLVRLTHVRLASTRKETLNESVHAAVSGLTMVLYLIGTAHLCTYVLRCVYVACLVMYNVQWLSLYVICNS